MRAVWLREFGGPEVLVAGTAPDPVAGPGQVVIAVEVANVTFLDTLIRSGAPGPFQVAAPVVPGNGVGGVVTEVGAGVDRGLLGRRVVASLGGSGGYAERVAVDADSLAEVPDGLGVDAATAVLADGRTASWLLDATKVAPGERVLVDGAAGGVGSLLVQLARAAGATVVAAAGGAAKVALAADLGAQVAVDYLRDDWPQDVRDAVGAVDVALDGVGGAIGRAAFDLLAPGGRLLSYGLTSGSWAAVTDEEAAARGVTVVRGRPSPADNRRYLLAALAAAAAGGLRPLIGQRFPLEEAAAAHGAIAARATVGKTLLVVRR
ncbi:zinc-binding dehydrogenase [Frankia sp. AgB1.9]|uniref:zinc-binding dehydrogenase n=1 Tax=unclassified Frankia TaxID=2632575 RepID=UPI001931B9FE|nr:MULTISPECIES: zinc-binding dehydrogenase [unclassified Frankia]MBL7486634.1 zinc-binding dehydrogenase [Frankia sp. AgW1.1]MBL7553963.1 zinc-binding dehydrogenase [Frankia sp. AgB1.9]MBL7618455.1 zinc-binding dehydrogenase [Frankia sp. AgB1.8]